jgi:phosphoheptose isomerase
MKKQSKIEIDGVESKFYSAVKTKEWKQLVALTEKAKRIFILANGGLYSVANHLGDDANRLLFKAGKKKTFYSPDSMCYVTSVSNDYGWNNSFAKWLEIHHLDKDCLVIGLSCSGRSKNVVTGLHYAKDKKAQAFLISGQSANILPKEIGELELKTEYFHSTEIICTILFYELIAELGGKCPLIKDEIERKSVASHLSRKGE